MGPFEATRTVSRWFLHCTCLYDITVRDLLQTSNIQVGVRPSVSECCTSGCWQVSLNRFHGKLDASGQTVCRTTCTSAGWFAVIVLTDIGVGDSVKWTPRSTENLQVCRVQHVGRTGGLYRQVGLIDVGLGIRSTSPFLFSHTGRSLALGLCFVCFRQFLAWGTGQAGT